MKNLAADVPALAGFDDTTLGPTLSDRRGIVVPAAGLCERQVLEGLNLTFDRIRALYGDEIGAPRDYHYGPHGPIFTIAGVRRLVSHLQLAVDVHAEGELPATHYGPKHHRGPWYLEGSA